MTVSDRFAFLTKKDITMKKIVLLLATVMCAFTLNAQVRFGVKAGVNFNSMSDLKISALGSEEIKAAFNNRTGFNAGLVLQAKIPGIGLSIQPELLYSSKGGKMDISSIPAISERVDPVNMRMDYLELPINIQWGIDLMLFRPYIQVSPYIGYAVGKFGDLKDIDWKQFNRFDYGIGVGLGLEIWKFQISGKYSWSLGKLSDFEDGFPGAEVLKDNIKGAKMRGFELSLAFLF